MEKQDNATNEAAGPKGGQEAPPLPGINFSTFIFSLNSSALVHLGMITAPGGGAKAINLPLAKQTIDILGMLEAKTAGNLTDEEINLLSNMLHDLRMMYVKLKEQGA
ncbi:DUF1844 domain-containing protein [Desulfoluna spongiiphila]|uniref:DUF1844 domain-containing protein n=1 Tax=Desulfoluna spongiiphila TaxID=419481 RepID=A0A1G5GG56_9BACT|nr:DUF1844 domain-containing protein [Desulfoluna spongiiphila]SCY50351.1 protein of unknown function [Desulfoluna spongiiphila]VVS93585.1 consensus disorder prediction [Desulfoluna spongiiphila]